MISLVAAMSSNRVIGKDQGLPWHLPEDLKFFKDTTKGKVIVMGRKTYESLGKPLPQRYNIVISRSLNVSGERLTTCSTLEEGLELAKKLAPSWDEEICIIGGAEIYSQSLGVADRIYLTEIHQDFDGDTFFPEFDPGEWKLVSQRDSQDGDLRYSFCVYEKVRK